MRVYFSLFMLMLYFFSQNTLAAPVSSLVLTDNQIEKLQTFFPDHNKVSINNPSQGPHIIWNGNPITMTLPLNQEKRIIFPTSVLFDAKGALTTDQLRLINNDKSLYLTALKSFPTTRIYVTLQESGEVLLMDLATDNQADNSTAVIDVKQNPQATAAPSASNNANTNASIMTTQTVDNAASASTATEATALSSESDVAVTLMRFAWQQLYAPERLLSNPQGISRVAMRTQPFVNRLVYGDKVMVHPLASWVYQNSYVTAIELRNPYSHRTALDIRHDLCGNWQSALVYPHSRLKPAGNLSGDSTTLLLISNKPFGESLEVCHA